MNAILFVLFVCAILAVDTAAHVVFRRSGFTDAQIDEVRLRRLFVWAVALWGFSGWYDAERAFAELTDGVAPLVAERDRCMAGLEERVGETEAAYAALRAELAGALGRSWSAGWETEAAGR